MHLIDRTGGEQELCRQRDPGSDFPQVRRQRQRQLGQVRTIFVDVEQFFVDAEQNTPPAGKEQPPWLDLPASCTLSVRFSCDNQQWLAVRAVPRTVPQAADGAAAGSVSVGVLTCGARSRAKLDQVVWEAILSPFSSVAAGASLQIDPKSLDTQPLDCVPYARGLTPCQSAPQLGPERNSASGDFCVVLCSPKRRD